VTTNDGVEEFYARGREPDRLRHGLGRLEWERSKELLERLLPRQPSVICDVGGGAGAYSSWLASKGHQVHLLDLSPQNIEAAHERDTEGRLAEAIVGDARALPWSDGVVDVVLLMGPLYHLPSVEDRHTCLAEARRVLAPGGLLVTATISRAATLLWVLSQAHEHLRDAAFRTVLERELIDGRHLPYAGYPGICTAFFHTPTQLREELRDCGFEQTQLFAVEGAGQFLWDVEAASRDEVLWQEVLRLLRMVEQDESLLGASPHVLGVARRA